MHVIEPEPVLADCERENPRDGFNKYIELYRARNEREITKKTGYSYSCCREAKKYIKIAKEDLYFCFIDVKTSVFMFQLLSKKKHK
jgi:hypothetical protein